MLDQYEAILQKDLHVGGANSAKSPEVKKYIRSIIRKDRGALFAHAISGGEEFAPTTEQEDYCEQRAKAYANGIFGKPANANPSPFDVLPNGKS